MLNDNSSTLLSAREIHGPYVQLLTNLQGENGKLWLSALNKFLRKENPWHDRKATPGEVYEDLLKPFGKPANLLPTANFVVADHFKINTDSEFPISCMGENFKAWLLSLTEKRVPQRTLGMQRLLKNSVDEPIIRAMGGKTRARTYMAHVWQFLKTADRSKLYIFYIKNINGVVCALRARWYVGGWLLDASAVSRPGPWSAGGIVVAR